MKISYSVENLSAGIIKGIGNAVDCYEVVSAVFNMRHTRYLKSISTFGEYCSRMKYFRICYDNTHLISADNTKCKRVCI